MKHVRLVTLSGFVAALLGAGSAANENEVQVDWKSSGNAKATQLQQCVEDTDVMRRDHMKFLMHQRDETMHKGIRTKKHSLINCISCHANKDDQGGYIPVNAEGQFCNSCHTFVGVSMDCFQCHATKPRNPADGEKSAHRQVQPAAQRRMGRLERRDLAAHAADLKPVSSPGAQ